MARRKNVDWTLPEGSVDYTQAQLAVLMDIRDELQELNRTLGCFRVRRMCDDVNRIERRLAKEIPLKRKRKNV